VTLRIHFSRLWLGGLALSESTVTDTLLHCGWLQSSRQDFKNNQGAPLPLGGQLLFDACILLLQPRRVADVVGGFSAFEHSTV
jgi:hypothetical protein